MEKQINRDIYLQRLINKRENGAIKIVTGLRRCGKSYLLFNLYYNYLLSTGVDEQHIIRLALDNDRNAALRNPDNLSQYLYDHIPDNREMYFVLLDEVQFAISDGELHSSAPLRIYGILNGLLQQGNVDIYITGSNSRFLSSDVATEFRGRGDEVHVNPLSFAEFLSAYQGGDRYDAWDEYTTYGGMPRLLSIDDDRDKAQYLIDLFNHTYVRDIAERNKLRADIILDNLIDVLASSVGSLNNPTKIAATFNSHGIKTTDKTIAAYIGYLQDAFLVSKAQRYDIKGRKYINSPYKYYFTDVGLRNARLNFRQQEPTHLMENVVYNELVTRGFNVDVGIVESRRTTDGKQTTAQLEVDFVCNQGNKRYYIQSAYSVPTAEKMQQEQASLDCIGDSFKKIIVTQDRAKPWRTEKGYLVINIFDFLLDSDSLDI